MLTKEEAFAIAEDYFKKRKGKCEYIGIAKTEEFKDDFRFVARLNCKKKAIVRKAFVNKFNGTIRKG